MLICFTYDGQFYPIHASHVKSLKEDAKANGELNSHIKRIEDANGKVLWERKHD